MKMFVMVLFTVLYKFTQSGYPAPTTGVGGDEDHGPGVKSEVGWGVQSKQTH